MTHPTATAATLLALLPTLGCAEGAPFARAERNTDLQPADPAQFRAPLENSGVALATETFVGGLEHPWGIEVMPDGAGYLVTERPGRLRHVAPDGTLSDPIAGLPDVAAAKQGGLLDVALGPDFATSRMIYWTYAKPVDGGYATAAGRGKLSQDLASIEDAGDIWVQTPAASTPMHFGSRIVFDGAGHAFITTGEHFTQEYRQYAQDLDKTFGKVVRVDHDGSVPDDNPFAGRDGADPTIWSFGHRNIQGAMMRDGALWTIEHGPQGGDELNRPEPGKNYGWPIVSYGENYNSRPVGNGEASRQDMEEPVYFWDPVIAPAGMMTYDGSEFAGWQGDVMISSLFPGGIVRLGIEDGKVAAEERLARELGRVRDLAVDTDGSILALTDFANGSIMRLSAK